MSSSKATGPPSLNTTPNKQSRGKNDCIVCENYVRKIREIQQTISGRDIIIEMLQKQIKKCEHNYKNLLEDYEQLRYRYCTTDYELTSLKDINEKLEVIGGMCRCKANSKLHSTGAGSVSKDHLQDELESCKKECQRLRSKLNQIEDNGNIQHRKSEKPKCMQNATILGNLISNQNTAIKRLLGKVLDEIRNLKGDPATIEREIQEINDINEKIQASSHSFVANDLIPQKDKKIKDLEEEVRKLKKQLQTDKEQNAKNPVLSYSVDTLTDNDLDNLISKPKRVPRSNPENPMIEVFCKEQQTDLSQSIDELLKQIGSLKKKLSELLDKENRLMRQLEQAEQSNNALSDTLVIVTEENKTNLDKIKELSNQLRKATQEAEDWSCQCNSKLNCLNSEIEQQRDKELELRTSLIRSEADSEELKASIKDLTEQNDKLKAYRDAMSSDDKQAPLIRELENSHNIIEDLKKQIRDQKKKLENLEDEIDSYKKQLSDLKNKYKRLKSASPNRDKENKPHRDSSKQKRSTERSPSITQDITESPTLTQDDTTKKPEKRRKNARKPKTSVAVQTDPQDSASVSLIEPEKTKKVNKKVQSGHRTRSANKLKTKKPSKDTNLDDRASSEMDSPDRSNKTLIYKTLPSKDSTMQTLFEEHPAEPIVETNNHQDASIITDPTDERGTGIDKSSGSVDTIPKITENSTQADPNNEDTNGPTLSYIKKPGFKQEASSHEASVNSIESDIVEDKGLNPMGKLFDSIVTGLPSFLLGKVARSQTPSIHLDYKQSTPDITENMPKDVSEASKLEDPNDINEPKDPSDIQSEFAPIIEDENPGSKPEDPNEINEGPSNNQSELAPIIDGESPEITDENPEGETKPPSGKKPCCDKKDKDAKTAEAGKEPEPAEGSTEAAPQVADKPQLTTESSTQTHPDEETEIKPLLTNEPATSPTNEDGLSKESSDTKPKDASNGPFDEESEAQTDSAEMPTKSDALVSTSEMGPNEEPSNNNKKHKHSHKPKKMQSNPLPPTYHLMILNDSTPDPKIKEKRPKKPESGAEMLSESTIPVSGSELAPIEENNEVSRDNIAIKSPSDEETMAAGKLDSDPEPQNTHSKESGDPQNLEGNKPQERADSKNILPPEEYTLIAGTVYEEEPPPFDILPDEPTDDSPMEAGVLSLGLVYQEPPPALDKPTSDSSEADPFSSASKLEKGSSTDPSDIKTSSPSSRPDSEVQSKASNGQGILKPTLSKSVSIQTASTEMDPKVSDRKLKHAGIGEVMPKESSHEESTQSSEVESQDLSGSSLVSMRDAGVQTNRKDYLTDSGTDLDTIEDESIYSIIMTDNSAQTKSWDDKVISASVLGVSSATSTDPGLELNLDNLQIPSIESGESDSATGRWPVRKGPKAAGKSKRGSFDDVLETIPEKKIKPDVPHCKRMPQAGKPPATCKTVIGEMQDTINKQKKEIADLQKENQKYQDQIRAIEKKNNEELINLRDQIAKSQANIDELLQEHDSKNEHFKIVCQEVEKLKGSIGAETDKYQSHVKSLEDENSRLKTDVHDVVCTCSKLGSEIEKLKTENGKKQDIIDELENTIDNSREILEECEKRVKALVKENESLRFNEKDLEKKIQDASKDIENLKNAVAQSVKEAKNHIGHLERENEKLRDQLNGLQNEIKRIEDQCAEHCQELRTQQKKASIESEKSQATWLELDKLNEKYRKLQKDYDDLSSENKKLKSDLEKYANHVDVVQKEAQRRTTIAENEKKELSRKLQFCIDKSDYENLRDKYDRLMRDYEGQSRELEKTKKDFEGCFKTSQVNREEYNNLKREYKEIKNMLKEQIEKYKSEAPADKTSKSSMCAQLKQKLLEKEKEIQDLQSKLHNASIEIIELKDQIHKLISDYRVLKSSINNLISDLERKIRGTSSGDRIQNSSAESIAGEILSSLSNIESKILRKSSSCPIKECDCISEIISFTDTPKILSDQILHSSKEICTCAERDIAKKGVYASGTDSDEFDGSPAQLQKLKDEIHKIDSKIEFCGPSSCPHLH